MDTKGKDSTALDNIASAIEHCFRSLSQGELYFGHGTDNAWDEAVQLVLLAADLPPDAGDEVLANALLPAQQTRVQTWLERRLTEQVPLPYLTGSAWFAGIEFACDTRAIIPRSPLAELILNDFQPWYAGPGPRRILDLCCGGGCIGLATACHHSAVQVDLADIDADALALAQENRRRLDLENRVSIFHSDLFGGLPQRRYDIILCNPPYVDADDLAEMPAEYHHEPALALGSGSDGLDLTRRILARARTYLEDHGLLVVEVGNSWPALEAAYPDVPFTWLEFEHGGHGVMALSASELDEYRQSLGGYGV